MARANSPPMTTVVQRYVPLTQIPTLAHALGDRQGQVGVHDLLATLARDYNGATWDCTRKRKRISTNKNDAAAPADESTVRPPKRQHRRQNDADGQQNVDQPLAMTPRVVKPTSSGTAARARKKLSFDNEPREQAEKAQMVPFPRAEPPKLYVSSPTAPQRGGPPPEEIENDRYFAPAMSPNPEPPSSEHTRQSYAVNFYNSPMPEPPPPICTDPEFFSLLESLPPTTFTTPFPSSPPPSPAWHREGTRRQAQPPHLAAAVVRQPAVSSDGSLDLSPSDWMPQANYANILDFLRFNAGRHHSEPAAPWYPPLASGPRLVPSRAIAMQHPDHHHNDASDTLHSLQPRTLTAAPLHPHSPSPVPSSAIDENHAAGYPVSFMPLPATSSSSHPSSPRLFDLDDADLSYSSRMTGGYSRAASSAIQMAGMSLHSPYMP